MTTLHEPPVKNLSTVDRFLPVWIVLAMALGLALGRFAPGVANALDTIKVGNVSLPIALGLLVMMYPVLAKVRYTEVGSFPADRGLMVLSLILNWVVGPAVMFALAWRFLPDRPDYRTGLLLLGVARQTLTNLETAKSSVSLDTALRAAREFGVSILAVPGGQREGVRRALAGMTPGTDAESATSQGR